MYSHHCHCCRFDSYLRPGFFNYYKIVRRHWAIHLGVFSTVTEFEHRRVDWCSLLLPLLQYAHRDIWVLLYTQLSVSLGHFCMTAMADNKIEYYSTNPYQ